MCPLLILFNAQCLNLSNKKMVFVCCSSSSSDFYINLHLHSIQLSFLFFFSFLVKVRFVLVIFCFFLLLVERRVGKFHKSFVVDHKLHRWQQHRMYKGSSGMGVASIYRLSPAQLNLFVVDNLSKQRFDEIFF